LTEEVEGVTFNADVDKDNGSEAW